MAELLLGSWGPQIVGYAEQYPWRVFAAVLVGILLIDMLLRQNRGTAGDAGIGGWDVGDGDAGCGD